MPDRFASFDDASLAVLVDRFYARVRADDLLGPVFEAAVHDWPAHLATLTDFWSSVMLTTGRYHGRPMQAHMRHDIRPPMFDRWLALWRETSHDLFEPAPAEQLVAKAERIGQSLSLGMFYRAADDAPRQGRPAPRR